MTKLRKADKRARQWDKNWMTKLYNGGGRASARHERRESSTVGRGRLPGSMTVVLRLHDSRDTIHSRDEHSLCWTMSINFLV